MLRVTTDNPAKLLEKFRRAIADQKIKTWSANEDGYFTRVAAAPAGTKRSWFKASVRGEAIQFNIIRSKQSSVTKQAYASYHARLSETLLAHFDQDINGIEISALAAEGDVV